jgi:hypothetical protein
MPTLRPCTRKIMIGDETRAALFAAEGQHRWVGVARFLAERFNDDVADPQLEGNSYFIGKGDFSFLVPKGGPITTISSLVELHDCDLAGVGDLDEEDLRRLRMLIVAIGKMMRSLHEAADEEEFEAA